MNRPAALCIVFTAIPAAALAQARPFVPAMSCAQATGLVRSAGAIVLSTGQFTYDRYLEDDAFCEADEYTTPAFVPTRDNPSCPIGYYCKGKPSNR
ncbi:MAG TPA: hypothetical protein VMU56_04440 [Beijerinckiaceae bacterium]|nr:hypothetical protein [Beijerinckiaceae bacterium]